MFVGIDENDDERKWICEEESNFFERVSIISTLNDSSLLSDQGTNQFFWYKCGLNFRSLIQLLETLSVELIGTHMRKTIGMEHLH